MCTIRTGSFGHALVATMPPSYPLATEGETDSMPETVGTRKRKLAAILSADVVGYGKLMANDDTATVTTLQEYRAAIARLVEHHEGRVVNAPGDNILAEFPSAVEAVQCATKIQKILEGRNLELSPERRMAFRIGINLGDVIEEADGTIYGDGVNVAARMEALAEAGGICISSKVLDEVEGKLDFGFDFLGEQPVKNIEKPVRVYRVRSAAASVGGVAQAGRTWRRPAAIIAAVAVVLLAIGGVVVWQFTQSPEPKTTAEAVGEVAPETEVASVERMAFPLPEEPSIAVLPFNNMSGDASQDYLADGIAENLIAALSQLPNMFVIARNSSFTYKGQAVKVQEVAEELGVRYVLEGSLQTSGDEVRVTAQLIDALSGDHLWAARYDRTLADIFALQDEITLNIGEALQIELTEGAQAYYGRRGTQNLEAWLNYWRGQEAFYRFTREGVAATRRYLSKAVEIDSEYALAWVLLGRTFWLEAVAGWTDSHDETVAQGIVHAEKALSLDVSLPDAYALLALLNLRLNRLDDAIAFAERAVALHPNHADAVIAVAFVMVFHGRYQEAIAHGKKAMRLNPHYPPNYLFALEETYRLTGRYEEQIELSRRYMARTPAVFPRMRLIYGLMKLERLEEVRAEVRSLLEAHPDFSLRREREIWLRRPYKDRAIIDELLAVMRQAGLPEYPLGIEPERPSIAVLPFENMSRDADQEYLADGIAGDLITELSRLRWLQVTARNSTFTYKGRAVDVKQVGHDLGVRYVVEGSVQRADNRVRISAQLIDASTGNNIWAERYERKLADIFVLQDEIADTVVAALQDEVGEFERERARRKPPESLDAWEFYQRGLWHLWRFSPSNVAEARHLFQRAAELDPNFAQTFAALGFALYMEVVFSYTTSPLENLDQAQQAANQAVALDDKEAMAHHTLGRVLSLRGDYNSAIAEMRTAIDLNPSSALAHFGLGTTLMLTEQLEEAISEFDEAIRLSPRDPAVWGFYALRAWARILLGDYESAVDDSRRAIRHPEAAFWPHAHLASALGHLGKHDEAKNALERLLEINPDFTPDAALAAHSPLNPDTLRPVFKTWIDGLQKAGLNIPAEPTVAD